MLRRVSSREISEWMALYQIEAEERAAEERAASR